MEEFLLAQDSAGFVRRFCSGCLRQFKTRAHRSDGRAVQRYLSAKIPHLNAHEEEGAAAVRSCLYCGRAAAPEDWLTLDQRCFLDRLAASLYAELEQAQLAYVLQTLEQNPRPTFVLVPPRPRRNSMPPELDDFELVSLLCCGEEAKADALNLDAFYCPRCGAHHENIGQPHRRL